MLSTVHHAFNIIIFLCRYCMQMKLPHKDFKWLTEQEISSLDVTKIDVNGDTGMILEVS